MIQIIIKSFQELTKGELYAVLQLRSEVFVVEQNCVYQDIDSKDQVAIHVMGFKNEKLVAYTRLFGPGSYFEEASIGRVVVKISERAYGYGQDIMKASIQHIADYYNTRIIHISAQLYLKKFYSSLGFYAVGEIYLEDDIQHIKMLLK